MRSIFTKIVGLLILLNMSLWLFVLVSDDFIVHQIQAIQNEQKLSSAFYKQITKPILTNKNLSEFDKNVRLRRILAKELLSDKGRLVIYRSSENIGLNYLSKYYDSNIDKPVSKIVSTQLPSLSEEYAKGVIRNRYRVSEKILSGLFRYYKPILDRQIITAPIHEAKARYIPQQEVRSKEFDTFNIRHLVPVKSNRVTVGIIEISEKYSLKDAYTERNAARLNLLGGISLITLLIGVMLSFSIAVPLRILSKRLDKELTPDDISQQLQSVRLNSLRRRKDEIGQLHNKLIKLTSQVGHLFKDKERFASEVSHELKNPIASIIAYAENFESQSAEDSEIVNKIKSQAIRMNKLVTEISDAAIVDHDLVTQHREKFNLASVVQEIVNHYVDSNEHRKVIITSDIPSKMIMTGLPERLGQVLVNLLDNALSFTQPSGDIKVTLSKRWRKPFILTVEDSGPGVDLEFRSAIFERFYTSRKGSAEVKNASGLGLHICQQIIEAHNGSITVETSKLGGAKFLVKIK